MTERFATQGKLKAYASRKRSNASREELSLHWNWTEYPEPTSSGIVRSLLDGDPAALKKEAQIKREYCRLLGDARLSHPEEFMPIYGVLSFIKRLQDEEICKVAIATGCFDYEARFKLECCGIDMDEFPHATSSDTPMRRDILPLAASRAGASASDIVYFGDAPWDFVVSRALPVHMIGIGRRIEQLTGLGLEHSFADFRDQEGILEALARLAARSIESAGAGNFAGPPPRSMPNLRVPANHCSTMFGPKSTSTPKLSS